MKKLIYMITVAVILTSCGSKDSDPSPAGDPPTAATLNFPQQNSLCISGNIISISQSSVVFSWNAGTNADSYDVVLKNLLTGNVTTTRQVGQTQSTITLARNTPYSWHVVARSSNSLITASSDTWRFYNAGAGVTAYAPFPADKLSPGLSQSVTVSAGKITLSWTSADADNDVVDHDVYFGTTSAPALVQKNVVANSLQVNATAATKYYWKVITRDAAGNTSTSDVVSFNTN